MDCFSEVDKAILGHLALLYDDSRIQIELFPDEPDDYVLIAPAAILMHRRSQDFGDSDSYGTTMQDEKTIFDLHVVARKLNATDADSADAIYPIISRLKVGVEENNEVVKEPLHNLELPDGSIMQLTGWGYTQRFEDEWWYRAEFSAVTGFES